MSEAEWSMNCGACGASWKSAAPATACASCGASGWNMTCAGPAVISEGLQLPTSASAPVAPALKCKPHRRDIRIGDIYAGDDEYLIRLFADTDLDGERIHWVDFEVVQVVGFDTVDSRKFFNRKGAQSLPAPVYSPDEAAVQRHVAVNHDPGDEDARAR